MLPSRDVIEGTLLVYVYIHYSLITYQAQMPPGRHTSVLPSSVQK